MIDIVVPIYPYVCLLHDIRLHASVQYNCKCTYAMYEVSLCIKGIQVLLLIHVHTQLE